MSFIRSRKFPSFPSVSVSIMKAVEIMNILVHYLCWVHMNPALLLCIYQEVELLNHWVCISLAFIDTVKPFLKVLLLINTHTRCESVILIFWLLLVLMLRQIFIVLSFVLCDFSVQVLLLFNFFSNKNLVFKLVFSPLYS